MENVLTLRPMTPDEYATYRRRIGVEYAQSHVEVGSWTPEEAEDKAEAELAEILGEGLAQPNTLLWTATVKDEPVGLAWVSLVHPRGTVDTAWLFDIEVFADHQGRGLGRALLAAVEREVVQHGVGKLGLNVFGNNRVALTLYASAGYSVTMQQMHKELSKAGPA